MNSHRSIPLLIILSLVCAASVCCCAAEQIVFEKHVRPILKANCFQCHGEEGKREGGLDLRLQRFIVKGGESGAGIEPGKPASSYLLERIQAGEMPPGDKKLSAEQVAMIERWIAAGAKTARDEPELIGAEFVLTEEEREFWSFQPIRRPPLPAGPICDPSWRE